LLQQFLDGFSNWLDGVGTGHVPDTNLLHFFAYDVLLSFLDFFGVLPEAFLGLFLFQWLAIFGTIALSVVAKASRGLHSLRMGGSHLGPILLSRLASAG
jgi:hypothetical protein